MTNQLKCGFSQCRITPELNGTFLDGYGFRLSPATGIRDELYLKTCVIICGSKTFAIVSFDLCGMSPRIYREISAHITALTGLDISQFALCSTHTHAGPACGLLAELPVNIDYYAYIGELAGKAVNEAAGSAAAGSFDFRLCRGELSHSYNRRGQPPIDRRILTAVFRDSLGRLRGVLSSASCHAVINTSMNISADFPSVLTEEGEKAYPGIPMLFLQGRGADINPYNPDGLGMEEMISALGHDLSGNVLASVEESLSESRKTPEACGIYSIYRNIRVPMSSYPEVNVLEKTVGEFMRKFHDTKPSPEKHYLLRELNWHRMVLARKKENSTADITVPLQIFTIGGIAAFAMVPFELLTLTGNALEDMFVKQGYSRESVYIIGCANSVNGYLAPKAEYATGGYEITSAAHWYGISECSAQSENAVLGGFEKMAEELTSAANS